MKKFLESGPAQILDTGMATAWFGHPLKLTFVVMEQTFVLEFRFVEDETVLGPQVRFEETLASVAFTCVNFVDGSGRGSAQPVLLRDLGSTLLWIHFRAFRYGATDDHTLHWTVYVVDKEAAGWSPKG